LFSEKCKCTPFFTFSSHLTWLSQKTVGDGEKLLTYLNSALKVLSGLDIFPRGTKNNLNFADSVISDLHIPFLGVFSL
jgi:hypothetical protein